jgi:hypothetical protein
MVLDQFPLADHAADALLLLLTAPEGFGLLASQSLLEQHLKDRFLLMQDWDESDFPSGIQYMIEKGWLKRAADRLWLSPLGFEARENLTIRFAQ